MRPAPVLNGDETLGLRSFIKAAIRPIPSPASASAGASDCRGGLNRCTPVGARSSRQPQGVNAGDEGREVHAEHADGARQRPRHATMGAFLAAVAKGENPTPRSVDEAEGAAWLRVAESRRKHARQDRAGGFHHVVVPPLGVVQGDPLRVVELVGIAAATHVGVPQLAQLLVERFLVRLVHVFHRRLGSELRTGEGLLALRHDAGADEGLRQSDRARGHHDEAILLGNLQSRHG
mmetsp:Transcript_68897/g.135286  ORF Transcript_68897/g.135286 Transcript_68897/m.135286 type:complete len:234 (+) Transcript_68897:56-757(+)